MRVIRYEDSGGGISFGIEKEGGIFRAEGRFPFLRAGREVADVRKLLTPIAPVQIMGIGQNYRKHAAESNTPIPEYPVLFIKNLSAAQNPGDPIRLPENLKTAKPDFEAELAVVIGKTCRNATEENALEFVAGYTCANDVSARDWQREWGGSQWSRGKSFDTFCPLGPVLVTTDEIEDPNSLQIKTTVNGEVMQDWNTSDMIFSVRKLIAFLSADTTLLPRTVILTGTPHGVGMGRSPQVWLKSGDQVVVDIERIGALANPVV